MKKATRWSGLQGLHSRFCLRVLIELPNYTELNFADAIRNRVKFYITGIVAAIGPAINRAIRRALRVASTDKRHAVSIIMGYQLIVAITLTDGRYVR